MFDTYAFAACMIAAVITAALRFIPFLIFSKEKETPPLILYLGKVLPFSIMGMLVIYCLKDVQITVAPYGIPEIIGCLIVAGLHIWKRNTLLSIAVGTVSYMAMVQLLF